MKKYIVLLTTTILIMAALLSVDHFLGLKSGAKGDNLTIKNSHVKADEGEKKPGEADKGDGNTGVWKIETSKVPILMYHAVEKGQSDLFVSPSEFEKQLDYLVRNNYNFIGFEDLKKGNVPKNPVIITFDDGYDNIYSNVFPLLKEYSAKATVFVIVDMIGKQGYLTAKEISEMNHIVSFQSHTLTHKELVSLNDESMENEIRLSKERLQGIAANKVIVLSYPCGEFNNKVIDKTKRYYDYGVTIFKGAYNLNSDPYKVSRVRVSKNDNISLFSSKIIKQ